MELIEIQTLIDITKTGVIRPIQGSELEINQNKNWTTLQQTLELRSIIIYDEPPKHQIIDIKNLGFGTKYKGNQKVWTFRFRPDRLGCYIDDDGNMIGLILSDLHQIPVIEKLTETINISKAVFDLQDPQNKNTIVSAIAGSE